MKRTHSVLEPFGRMTLGGARRVPALAAVAAMALSACVEAGPPGLTVKALPANLVFGSPPEPILAAAPANSVAQPIALPPLPPPRLSISMPPRFTLPPIAPAADCPVAGINVFPAEVAARNVDADRRPALGIYRWTREGTQSGTHTAGFEIPASGFERREISNLVDLGETQFTYDLSQKDAVTNELVVTTYQVRTAGTSVGPDTIGLDPVPDAPDAPTVGEPDRGISITRIARYDSDGTQIADYNPSVPLLLLPLPVRVDEQFQSASTDPTTLQQITFEGTVQPVTRVDACGEVVEGWPVAGSMTISLSNVTETRDYEVVFIPQMGGIMAYEHVVGTSSQGAAAATLDIEFTLGQLEPDPAEA